MPAWDPGQYLAYAGHRLRPALDLLTRIPGIEASNVWDLGCGAGNVTRHLADRWPAAQVTGIDSSDEMLERARQIDGIAWVHGTIEEWDPGEPADVVYANASLHWVDDHERVFPDLISKLRPGGVLAVGMPRNFSEPSHALLRETAAADEFAADLSHVAGVPPVRAPAWYHRVVGSIAHTVDLWETIYQQVLDGPDAVANWTKGTAARPYLEALSPDRAHAFFTRYAAGLSEAYPPQPDGTTLFPFRRLFLVAVR